MTRVIERLDHLPDVSADIASEARTRAGEGAAPREFFEWLAQATSTSDEPAEPIDCDCGAALIDPATWRGRAIVRCGVCGSRWGVEVTGAEEWSQWGLDAS